jgi:diaminopimelate decarboxylase
MHTQFHLLPDTATISPGGVLHIANHAVPDLAQQYGTPLYIFDKATIINACKSYWEAFRTHYHASAVRMLYASKAYLSPLIARLIAEQGMGLDVVSGGELLVAQRADFPMERVSFHGNNKSEDELRLALKLGVGRIVLDNWSELGRLTRIVRETAQKPGVLLRVAPDVSTDTHRYLQTGHAASKFGFPLINGEAKAAILRILSEGQLRLLGLHAHTGTMLREARPYQESLERLLALAYEVYQETGWWPEEISPGGGWAIDTPDNPSTPGVEVLAQALQVTMEKVQAGAMMDVDKSVGQRLGDQSAVGGDKSAPTVAPGPGPTVAAEPGPTVVPTLVIEPGRSIIARAGVAVYRIGARKPTPGGITYLFVDGGMADNIRPALYGAQYTALAVERALVPLEENVCVSGRYCESGDMLIESVMLPRMHEGELLALPTAGAYCLPMASNYNLVPRPAVLLVDEQNIQVMERRETYEDVLARYQM